MPWVAVDLTGGFQAYWDVRGKSLRKNLRRYQNRIESTGMATELRMLDSPSEISHGLKQYGLLESAGWKGAAGTAIHPDNAQGRFYEDVLSRFAATGDALIAELRVGGRLVASRLCVRSGPMLVILKTAYDESAADYAPGRVLLYLLLKELDAARRAQAVEFYTNATADQLAWASSEREIVHVSCRRSRIDDALMRSMGALRRVRAKSQDADPRRPEGRPPGRSPGDTELAEGVLERE